MKITCDYADPSRTGCVPRHGWAKNSQGVKLLRLPILRLLHQVNNIRKANGLKELSWGQWSEIKAFDQIVEYFVLTLRELAKCIRIGADPCFDQRDNDKFNTSIEASSLIPLYIDLAFVYARRMADHLARASRYTLFKHAEKAPREYKKLRPLIADSAKLQRLEPICDRKVLQEGFEQHSAWLDKLRDSIDDSGEPQKGIRDIMEHHPIAVHVHHTKVGEGPWEVKANLGEPINANFKTELIPTLKMIIGGMADLWTMVCVAANLPAAEHLWITPYGDTVVLSGNDEDSTEFWPESVA